MLSRMLAAAAGGGGAMKSKTMLLNLCHTYTKWRVLHGAARLSDVVESAMTNRWGRHVKCTRVWVSVTGGGCRMAPRGGGWHWQHLLAGLSGSPTASWPAVDRDCPAMRQRVIVRSSSLCGYLGPDHPRRPAGVLWCRVCVCVWSRYSTTTICCDIDASTNDRYSRARSIRPDCLASRRSDPLSLVAKHFLILTQHCWCFLRWIILSHVATQKRGQRFLRVGYCVVWCPVM